MTPNLINERVKELYQNCSYIGAKYIKTQNECVLTFFYDHSKGEVDKDKILKICESILSLKDVKISIDLKKTYLDEELITKFLLKYFSKFGNMISVKREDILVTIENDKALIQINLIKEYIDYLLIKEEKDKIIYALNQHFLSPILISFNPIDKNIIQDLENREENFRKKITSAEEHPAQRYEVKNIVGLIGDEIKIKPQVISSIIHPEESVAIAGTIQYLKKSEYTKMVKAYDTGVEKPVTKVRINFSLVDPSGKIDCVLFPNKKNIAIVDKIIDGMSVVIFGDIESYQERLSYKIKYLSTCELPNNLVIEKHYKNEADFYSVVEPERYYEEIQTGLFINNEDVIPDLLKNNTFVVFDLETSGLEPTSSEIIEIGAVKIDGGKIVSSFSTLIKPKNRISEEITKINGITNEMVAYAPQLEHVIADFYKYTRGAALVAHNIEFDSKFLQYYANKLSYNFQNEKYDTLNLARKYISGVKNYKLITLCDSLNISLVNAHRALNDTIATAKLFIEITKRIK